MSTHAQLVHILIVNFSMRTHNHAIEATYNGLITLILRMSMIRSSVLCVHSTDFEMVYYTHTHILYCR